MRDTSNSPARLVDRIPEIKVQIPDTKKPVLIKLVKNPTLGYNSDRFAGRGSFHPAEYELAESGRVEDTDSYVRQAFDKKVALMFKEGWDIIGTNPRTVKYIRARLTQISRASGTPVHKLMRSIGSSLIRKSNAFLIKVRDVSSSGGKSRIPVGKNKTLKPVAAYFVAPAETMEYHLSGGKIVKWRQRMPDGVIKEWLPENVVHFYYDRKDGFVFGTPILVPVIDDIRALRKIEENIELLVYQHLFPLFHYKVGTDDEPAGLTENGIPEVDIIKQEIQFMPTEGGIVTSHRHEITAIGAEGRAIRAEGYLEHFKKRVLSGLGISAVDMGEGETANRATADNMSRNLVDSVKDIQQVMEIFVNDLILNELLLESTFGDSVLDEENICFLKFKEIDVEAQIKKQAHHSDMFNKDIVTWDEARKQIGLDPIAVPSMEEIETGDDLAEQYPEWHKTRWKLFKEPEVILQSIDEAGTPLSKAIARISATSVTSGDVQEAGDEKQARAIELEKTKAAGRARSATVKKKDSFIRSAFTGIGNSVYLHIDNEKNLDHDWIAARIRLEMTPIINSLLSMQVLAFRTGYTSNRLLDPAFMNRVSIARTRFQSRAEHFLNKLVRDTISALKRNVNDNMSAKDMVIKARAVFNSLMFRADFIEDVEIRKAFNLGVAQALRDSGHIEMRLNSIKTDSTCGECKVMASTPIELTYITLERIPPFHAACHCSINTDIDTTEFIRDNHMESDDNPEGIVPSKGQYTPCPKCDKTALRNKEVPDVFNCRACGHVFRKVEDVEETEEDGNLNDVTKLESCVISVKAQLKKKNPDMSEDKIKSSAFAICNARLKGK